MDGAATIKSVRIGARSLPIRVCASPEKLEAMKEHARARAEREMDPAWQERQRARREASKVAKRASVGSG